jgi:signal transduction histidine kinase
MAVPGTQPEPLRRDPAGAVLGGVCAGLAPRIGLDPRVLRVAFLAASIAGGVGIFLYLVCWVLLPAGEGEPRGLAAVGSLARRENVMVAAGLVLLLLAALLLLRVWGLWLSDAVVWPLTLAAAGGALIWRHSQHAEVVAPPPVEQAKPGGGARPRRTLRLARPSLAGAGLGTTLVLGGGLVFLWLTGALTAARDVVLAVVVVVVAIGVILTPWWLRLVRGLTEEREERVRTQERAELAAHLHDSVLQTLALMQKRADDPREVAALARRQERELRAWLNADRRGEPRRTFAGALAATVAELEDDHGVPVEVVAVGDCPLDEAAEALVAAAREAVLNAVKFSGGAPISVYAEADGDRVEVFVRDRGPGFDLAAVPADRRGLRESVLGRMDRHGGEAHVHTWPGAGTEVELVLPR